MLWANAMWMNASLKTSKTGISMQKHCQTTPCHSTDNNWSWSHSVPFRSSIVFGKTDDVYIPAVSPVTIKLQGNSFTGTLDFLWLALTFIYVSYQPHHYDWIHLRRLSLFWKTTKTRDHHYNMCPRVTFHSDQLRSNQKVKSSLKRHCGQKCAWMKHAAFSV